MVAQVCEQLDAEGFGLPFATTLPRGCNILVALPETIHLRQTFEKVSVDCPGDPKLLAELLAEVVGLAVLASFQQAPP